MFITTDALVLREVKYKEADRILTLYTASNGKITAKARGALRKTSRTGAGTQQLTFSSMTLFFNKGKWTVNEASVIEAFDGLKEDIARLALASYFAECVETLSVEEQGDGAMLSLVLNSLYALSRALCDERKIKAAFELRLMGISGFMPAIDGCCVCGRSEPVEPLLSPEDGTLACRSCRPSADAVRLDEASLAAMRHILNAPLKQFLSFRLPEDSLSVLSSAAESYFLTQTERRFGTLSYYKNVKEF